MATNILIDVYEFSTGMDLTQKYTQPFVVVDIQSYQPASIYNFKNVYFPGVRSKITASWGGVLKDYYVAQTVAQIKTLLDA